MSEKYKKFNDQLGALITQGNNLLMSIQNDCRSKDMLEAIMTQRSKTEEQALEIIGKWPNFRSEYQSWYSEAKCLIEQILPNRLDDFINYYEFPTARKEITFANYMIKDYLQGLSITRGVGEVIVDASAAIPEFQQQLNIVKAARKILDSRLLDITSILQADLFDSEIESANL